MVQWLVVDVKECLEEKELIESRLKAILVVESAKIVEGNKLQSFVDNVCERTFLKDDIVSSMNALMTQRGVKKPAITQQKIVLEYYDPLQDDFENDTTASKCHPDQAFKYEKHFPEAMMPDKPPSMVHYSHRMNYPSYEACLTRKEGYYEM